jgi:O-antigen/teichoic acid export membrane protein
MRDTTSLSVGREALYSLVSKLVMALIGFGGTVVFARLLGPSGLGVYRTALAVAFVATQVSGGVGSAIQKRVSEVDTDPQEFFGAGLVVHLGITVVVLVGLVLLIDPAATYFGSIEVAFGAVAVVATLGLFNVVNRMYAGIGYPARSSWMDTIRSVVTLGFQLLFLWAGMEAFGLLAGLALGTLASGILSMVVAGVRPSIPDRETFDRVYSFARWSVPNGLLTNLYSNSDVMIITAVVGSAATGLYTTALQLVMPAAMLAGSIGDALNVRTSGRSSASKAVDQDLLNALSYTGLFAIPMLFGALAMPRAIPRTLFGPEFAAAGAALIGMALFQIGNVYAKPFESAFPGIDKPGVVFRVNLLILVVHLPLAAVLGIEYGLIGVVGATVTAEGIRIVVYQILAYREFERIALSRPMAEQFVSAGAMYLMLEAVLTTVGVRNWVVLVALVGAGAAVYFGTLFAISSHFRVTLGHALPVDLAVLGGE